MEVKSSLSTMERHDEVRRYVEQHQRATVNEIADYFSVSVATVRRDLEIMADQGQIQRFHGGAMSVRKSPPELPAIQRSQEQADEKKRIGQAAVELIKDGETVFISGGTTALEVARYLPEHRNLTVITNALQVVNTLAGTDIEVVVLGGVLRHSEMSMIGHITEQALREVHAHKIILGIRAIDLERGLTNDTLSETLTDRAVLGLGGEVIVVADHTKCGAVSTASVAPITTIHTLVTDTKAPAAFVKALQAKRINVILA